MPSFGTMMRHRTLDDLRPSEWGDCHGPSSFEISMAMLDWLVIPYVANSLCKLLPLLAPLDYESLGIGSPDAALRTFSAPLSERARHTSRSVNRTSRGTAAPTAKDVELLPPYPS